MHFVFHHYGKYLGLRGKVLGMTRSDLEPLDVNLYMALRDWPRRNNRNHRDWLRLEKRLPTLSDRNNEIIAALFEGRGVQGLTSKKLKALASALSRKEN